MPSESELTGQIENYIKDQVFYKEAVALGLDQNDPAIKKRMRQMMELMMDDLASVYPSESQLNAYLKENEDKFRSDPRISFRHIYFDQYSEAKAEQVLKRLKNNEEVKESEYGNLALIPDSFEDESFRGIDRLFGKTFTQELFELENTGWQGPIQSAYGFHVVHITKRDPGYVPPLEEIWDLVEREWSVDQKLKAKERQYEQMKKKYIIQIDTVR